MENSNQLVVMPVTVTFTHRVLSPAVEAARMRQAAILRAKEVTKAVTTD